MQRIVTANHYCCLMTRLSACVSPPAPLHSTPILNIKLFLFKTTFLQLLFVIIPKIGVDYLENNCAEEPNKLCEFKRLSGRILKTVDSVYQDVSNIDECRELCLNSPYRYRLKCITNIYGIEFKDISYFKL